MKYVFDLDGTICSDSKGNYRNAKPIPTRVSAINGLYDQGHTIVIFSARGMGRSGGNRLIVHLRWYILTKSQLKRWNVRYHKLRLGKPAGDIYVDDKGSNADDFFK